jgi:mRNA-degrading endonuclease toxin of MazEF toxin-antitoxin module
MKRGEIWWADLGAYRLREQTGRRPVVIWQSELELATDEALGRVEPEADGIT